MIITETNNDDNDVVKQYQDQRHTTSKNHPKRHSVKALTLTLTKTPKIKGKQPHNTYTMPPAANNSIKQPAENRNVQERQCC